MKAHNQEHEIGDPKPISHEQNDSMLEAVEESIEEAAPGKISEPEEVEEPTIEGLQAKLELLQNQADEYLDGWQRARAEFANYKKRIERERTGRQIEIKSKILNRYLDILDDLERALNDRPTEDEGHTWATGIELIHNKLSNLLESEGVEPIHAKGETFDPNFHDAISYEEADDFQDGQVIEVVQKGYQMGDRVLRPAKVRVAK
jgi:molecular chaperone GrpE